jgi:hypothetical protein
MPQGLPVHLRVRDEGHPDKICDQISDGVVDALIEKDPHARIAVETLVKTGIAIVAGEVTTTAWIDIPSIVRNTITPHRLHRLGHGLRRQHLWRHGGHRRPVAGHRARRRRGLEEGAGRRRPGHDVRLRLQRDRRADARADHYAHALTRKLADSAARSTTGFDPTASRRSPSSTRTASRCASTPSSLSTQHAEEVQQEDQGRHHGGGDQGLASGQARGQEDQVLHQPHRPLRHRRPHGRLGRHGPQDHRRHLRRHGPSRRRRVLGQGPLEGRPLGRVHGPLHREERRGRRPRRPLRSAGLVRHRRRRARQRARRDVRHREGR